MMMLPQGQPTDARTRLLQALAKRAPTGAKASAKDARYARLAALPPYGEIQGAETLGGRGANAHEAFQDGAYQDGGYQIF